MIATQSDDQAHGLSIRELERIRDDNLVAIMDALSEAEQGQGLGRRRASQGLHQAAAKLARRSRLEIRRKGKGSGEEGTSRRKQKKG